MVNRSQNCSRIQTDALRRHLMAVKSFSGILRQEPLGMAGLMLIQDRKWVDPFPRISRRYGR